MNDETFAALAAAWKAMDSDIQMWDRQAHIDNPDALTLHDSIVTLLNEYDRCVDCGAEMANHGPGPDVQVCTEGCK